jgi:hypothetical protein
MVGMVQGNLRPSALTLAGVYIFLLFLFLWPLVDLASTVWPFLPGSLQWRYGFLGLLTAYWHTPILAIVLGMFVAMYFQHRKTLRALSVFSFLWAACLFVVLILFPLDVIQLRAMTPAENRSTFQAGAIFSELKHLTAFAVVLLLGWGGWRTGRKLPGARDPESSDLTAEVLKAQKRS